MKQNKHITDTSQLPLVFSIDILSSVLSISRSKAYQLANSSGFPRLNIDGKRILIPKDAFLLWLRERSTF